jgi:hypothetical protein
MIHEYGKMEVRAIGSAIRHIAGEWVSDCTVQCGADNYVLTKDE